MGAFDLAAQCARFVDYCRDIKSLSSNTLDAYAQDLTEFRVFVGLQTERDFSGELMGAYVRWLREERELSPATVRRRIACLKAFFKWAKEGRALPRSPFDDTAIVVRIPKRLPRALSRQQVREVAGAVGAGPDRAMAEAGGAGQDPCDWRATTYLAVCLMLATGIRVGELTAIRLKDLDPDCTIINVSGKGSRDRTVFLANAGLSAALRAYVGRRMRLVVPDDLLLRNARGRPLTPQALRIRLRKLGEGLAFSQRLTPHRFRHTAATILLEEGIDIRYVQRLLGHSTISTTEIYTHVTDISLRQALERADVVARVGV
ncbi:tyrosine-type recombinase/integrase [Breoghania sp. L-A4]|uniref:tyrosine-type recombinase/integrase n=1 Tax=Breoghania sp. L-A4 TaxID=2304600 RepID=UPI000E358547|nr:tyrosine-type recombinase/integrase [Breoghania sp. L-A4]AXS39597.1 hypothetical protein D1F64_05460 [Breoghania sp. L-A4]